MPYLGVAPNPRENREVDDISGSFNGSTTAFTLQAGGSNVSPGKDTAIIVYLGGVVQNPGTDYTIAASTITFTTAPASGLTFFGVVLAQSIDIETTADNTVTTAKIVDGAVTNAKVNASAAIAASKIADFVTGNTNNRVLTATGTANSLNGEANLTFDGSNLSVTGGLDVSSDVSIADTIKHTGDTNTKIRFPAADTVSIETSGSERARFDANGHVLIGKTVSTDVFKEGNLQVRGSSSDAASIIVESTVTGTDGPNIILGHSRGGSSVGSGDILGDITFTGHDGTDLESRGAIIRAKISAAVSSNDMPTHLQFFTCQDGNNNLTMGMQVSEDSTCLAAKAFVSKKSNDASVNTSTASGFTANTFNVVLGQDVLEAQSTYLITFFWNHQGSGQPFESYGSFTFQPGSTNPGSTGAMGPDHVPLQGAHTEQGVSKFWTFRYYSSTGQHTHGLQAAFNQNLNDANGNGQLSVHAVKLADTTTI